MGGLIQDQERRYRPSLLSEPPMECEVCQHMVADPVLPAAHPLQRHRAVERVGHDREILDVEALLISTEM